MTERTNQRIFYQVLLQSRQELYGDDRNDTQGLCETKQQCSQWKRPDVPRPKKARQSRSHVKSMQFIFFNCEGVVHYDFAPRRQTINKRYYVEVLKGLRDAVIRKRPRFWSSGDWLLHHDNAPAHSSYLVQQFLAKHKIVQLLQPPYSPDIASCDF